METKYSLNEADDRAADSGSSPTIDDMMENIEDIDSDSSKSSNSQSEDED